MPPSEIRRLSITEQSDQAHILVQMVALLLVKAEVMSVISAPQRGPLKEAAVPSLSTSSI